jgi:hypothetical protein
LALLSSKFITCQRSHEWGWDNGKGGKIVPFTSPVLA